MKLSQLVTSALIAAPALAVGDPLVVAHRGSSFTAPENTMAAFELGWKQNSDVVELDVHLSKDKRLIVIHDATTSRTTGVPLTVAEADSNELRKLDAGGWKDPKYKGERLPFLEEALPTIPAGKKMFVEIKSDRRTVPYVKEAILKAGKEKDCVIITFDIDTAEDAKKALPNVPVYWLKSTEKNKKTKEPIPHGREVLEKAKSRNLDGVDLNYLGVTKELVEAAKKEGLGFHVWTVDEPEDMRRMAEYGVDSITTNKPDVLLEVLGKRKSEKKTAQDKVSDPAAAR